MDQLNKEARESLNKSLARLGRTATVFEYGCPIPEVFIQNELAIAVRRFGWTRIARTIIRNFLWREWEWFKYELTHGPTDYDSR